MKSLFNKILLVLVLLVIILVTVGGFMLGRSSVSKPSEDKIFITSQTILEKITNEYFVVTKTIFLDQETEISVLQGSEWENILWGKDIFASGLVRVDLGVDLTNLTVQDITIDETNKTIKVNMPNASILDSSISGNIEFKTEKGIITSIEELLEDDESSDYNEATAKLIAQAELAVDANTEVKDEAREDSKEIISLIIEEMGYTLID